MPYYHARITRKSRRSYDSLELDLSEEELKKRIVDPFMRGEPFICGGEPIDPFDVETIHLNKTEVPSGDLLPKIRAEKARSSIVAAISDEWYVTKEGKDVTRELITSPPKKADKSTGTSRLYSKNVFIVHGRDHEPMKDLKAMLLELGLNPIVLHEQPSGSKTVVEKLEEYSDVGYAFVVLTPDDASFNIQTFREKMDGIEASGVTGRRQDDAIIDALFKITTKVVRQNVILEFGYFMHMLGRDRVCCLYKGNVELPSDMHGIVYISFKDSVEEVRLKIMKELKRAGYEIRL